jgi:hypothetical protein
MVPLTVEYRDSCMPSSKNSSRIGENWVGEISLLVQDSMTAPTIEPTSDFRPTPRMPAFRASSASCCERLPTYSAPRNLVHFSHLPHTRLTYHRTWETGLEAEIRVADFNPAFFCLRPRGSSPVVHAFDRT